MRDPKSLTDSLEGFDPLSDQQKAKARITVCHWSEDAAQAAEIMKMLGIAPGQHDDDDNRPILPLPGNMH
jgi:hypothetical protein